MNLEKIAGVGEERAKRLREAGYNDLEDVAKETPARFSKRAGIPRKVAKKIIKSAREVSKSEEEIKAKVKISAEKILMEGEFREMVIKAVISSEEMDDIAEEVAGKMAEVIEDDASLRKELVAIIIKSPEKRQRIIDGLIEELQ